MVLRRGQLLLATLMAVALVALIPAQPAAASSSPYAHLNRPGPRLSVAASALRHALSCAATLTNAARDPVLLVPGTNLDPAPNYSWNYERAFSARHWPYCSLTLPFHTMGDVQLAGEYVVYALRTMAKASKRRVDVLGYSQGGMVPRWALRFWPDTRRLVHDLVGLDPSNHGTLDAAVACHGQCPPAYWQQATGSRFLAALNSRAETFAAVNYTVIFSHTDEVVVPNTSTSGSSSLHTGKGNVANIAVQQICPTDISDHLAMGTYDPVGYALVLDALTHAGTANSARISSAVCAQPLAPDVDTLSFASNYASFLAAIGRAAAASPQTASEPRLRCYVFEACKTAVKRHRRRPHHRHVRPGHPRGERGG